MDITKSDDLTITLEKYSIDREAIGEPVTIRAELQILTPKMKPETMRLRVRYQCDGDQKMNERDLARTLFELLQRRFLPK
jgi:hypothetical protein